VARLGRALEFERRDAVLKRVWESDESALAAFDIANLLDAGAILSAGEHFPEPFEVVLRVANVVGLGVATLAEGEATGGNVYVIIVVEGGGTDVFVLAIGC
jgi:hypothetical protein